MFEMNVARNFLLLFWILYLSNYSLGHLNDNDDSEETLFNQLKFSVLDTNPSQTPADYANLEFHPIRIHIHETNWETLDNQLSERLREILRGAVEKISTLLSVRRVEGNLLLERKKACKKYFITKEKDVKKCHVLSTNYRNEYCADKIDSFMIPKEHLSGINHYESAAAQTPTSQSLKNGTGIPNTDFVLYAAVKQTDLCQRQDVMAYSSYCQLGLNNRPVAGFVNFCPLYLKTDKYNFKKSYLTTIHELFHALGFSSNLFGYFKDCDGIGNCYDQKVVVREENRDIIMLPTVVEKMQKHFGCDDPDFGAVLNFPEKDDSLGSHWDPLIFHYSIMAPRITDANLTAIDPITLSVFEGTGWYKVNYTAADDYLWGKGIGCNLLQFEDCSYPYTCAISDEKYGCDFHHASMSKCEVVSPRHNCGIYKVSVEKCSVDGDSSCFVIETNATKTAKCFKHRCVQNVLQIEVENKWFNCPKDSQIDVQFLSEYEIIFCQSVNLCRDPFHLPKVLPLKDEKVEIFSIWFEISSPTPEEVIATHFKNDDEFKEAAVRRVADIIRIPYSWIKETKLVLGNESRYGLLVKFSKPIRNANEMDKETLKRDLKLREFIKRGNVTVDLEHLVYVSPMESRQGLESEEKVKGLQALWLLLGVVALAAILSLVGITLFDRKRRNRNQTNVVVE